MGRLVGNLGPWQDWHTIMIEYNHYMILWRSCLPTNQVHYWHVHGMKNQHPNALEGADKITFFKNMHPFCSNGF